MNRSMPFLSRLITSACKLRTSQCLHVEGRVLWHCGQSIKWRWRVLEKITIHQVIVFLFAVWSHEKPCYPFLFLWSSSIWLSPCTTSNIFFFCLPTFSALVHERGSAWIAWVLFVLPVSLFCIIPAFTHLIHNMLGLLLGKRNVLCFWSI